MPNEILGESVQLLKMCEPHLTNLRDSQGRYVFVGVILNINGLVCSDVSTFQMDSIHSTHSNYFQQVRSR
jgi:hypothetical protein